nr:uncharacterized protein LOC109168056 [Ipomoea batatas]
MSSQDLNLTLEKGTAPSAVKKEKGKGKIQPTNEPGLLKPRMSPMELNKLLQKLTDEQKNAVQEIGCALRLEKEEMLLTEDDVESTLGLPKGDIQVVEGNNSNATIEYNNLVEEWRVHWGIDSCSPLVKRLYEGIGERKDHGDMFKRDFVVFVVSSLFKGHAKWTSNFKILYSLMDVNNIKNLNWLQFKGQQIERKFPAISAWTVDMVQKRFASEKRSGAFGRGKVLDRVRKPVADVENNETIGGKEKESDGVEVQLNLGKLWLKLGAKTLGKTLSRKLSARSDMLIASTSQPAETSTLLDDDPIFNDKSFLATVSALEKAFIVTTNPAEHPKEVELDGLPSSPSWNLLTPTLRMFKSQMKQPPHALLNTMHLPISKRLKRAQQ